MKLDFLSKLFLNTSEPWSSPPPGDRLSALYVRLEETTAADSALGAALGKLDAPELATAIDSAATDFATAREKQGFINGLRLGIRLFMELGLTKEDLLNE